jgi:ferredoxin
VPDSEEHKVYYSLRPENLKPDEKLRSLPGLLAADAQKADPLVFPTAEASFDLTEALRDRVDGIVAEEQVRISPEVITPYLKGLIRHLGADQVGITALHPTHVYSHVGRGTGIYGEPITLTHSYAIAFTVEMDYALMGTAPDAPVVLESARKYVDGAVIAVHIANLCRRLGYPARAHIDGNYQVIAPLVARSAGLGEIGRMGILMTPKLGPRVRLSVVTTDLPLVPDLRRNGQSMIDFCSICMKCVENCPSKAIPSGAREEIDGAYRWKLNEDRCFHYWNVIGSDCGICMAVCPYSHPDNWAHNLIRAVIDRSGFARRVMLRLDDLFYGRKPPHRIAPSWFPH